MKLENLLTTTILSAGLLATPALAAERLGTVVSVQGPVHAEAADGSRRLLQCGDAIHTGDRVALAGDARLGVLAADVYSQVEPSSTVAFARAAAGGPAVALESGRVRVVDTRAVAGAPHHELRTPDAVAVGLAGDSEAYVLEEKGGAYSMVCEWAEPLQVSRSDEQVTADAERCAIAREREPLYLSDAHPERIALAERGVCDPGPLLGAAAPRFDTTDVAAGPPPPSGLLAPAPPAFALDPCDTTSCLSVDTSGLGIVESPAMGGSLPGATPGALP